MNLPERIRIANLPTRIERLESLSSSYGKNIYIKRDDQTGTEFSGNKVRKLEFALKEALDQKCDYLITCGGIQSNHARATAAVAARFGLSTVLVLRGGDREVLEGNYFLGKLLGADIRLISPEDYKNSRMEIMESIKEELGAEGHKAYILPEGASNAIGSFGYANTMMEIGDQEKELDIKFDAVVVTVGSGGSYTGLLYGNRLRGNPSKIYGINICDDREFFTERAREIGRELNSYTSLDINLEGDINILDGYVGLGYALSRQEEIDFIRDFARAEGIVLDPVYTGKAMYGFTRELAKGSFDEAENILFIHTGGIFGWTKKAMSMLD